MKSRPHWVRWAVLGGCCTLARPKSLAGPGHALHRSKQKPAPTAPPESSNKKQKACACLGCPSRVIGSWCCTRRLAKHKAGHRSKPVRYPSSQQCGGFGTPRLTGFATHDKRRNSQLCLAQQQGAARLVATYPMEELGLQGID